MTTSGRLRGSIGAASLAALAMFITQAEPITATDAVLPPDQNAVIHATEWLDGQGVPVYYSPGPYDDHPQNPDGTIQYECVELVMRLYLKLGYPVRWPFRFAYEIAGVAGTPGFKDVVFQPNGALEAPRVGDIVVWPSFYNGGTGHVAIVNKILDNWVEIVHQNVWRGFRPMPVSNMVLQHDRHGRFILLGRDGIRPIGWIHSRRMERWLHHLPPLPDPGTHPAL